MSDENEKNERADYKSEFSGPWAKSMERLTKEIARTKNAWLRACMEQILPGNIFAMAYDENGRDRMKVQRYLTNRQIRLREYPDRTELVRGAEGEEELLSEFKAEFNDGKLNILYRGLLKPLQPPTA